MFSVSRVATVLLGIALVSTASFAMGKDNSKAFLKNAGRDGMAEVSFARIALQRASNVDIQDFAKQMVDDHSAANDKIASLAKDDKVMLHKDLSPKQKAMEKKLMKLNDRDRAFDRAYAAQAVEDHEKAVKAFERQAAHGTDADVRAFAEETLPTLKHHLEMATALKAKLDQKPNR